MFVTGKQGPAFKFRNRRFEPGYLHKHIQAYIRLLTMSEKTCARAESFKSQKRARTAPQTDCDGPDLEDESRRLNRRQTAPRIEGRFSSVAAHQYDISGDREQEESTKSVATTKSCSPTQHSGRPADEHSAPTSSLHQGPPEAPIEDSEGDGLSSAVASNFLKNNSGSSRGEILELVTQPISPRGENLSEEETVPCVDEITARNTKSLSAPPSNEDSDSIYDHLDEFDPDELAAILGDASGPVPSGDEFVASPTLPHPREVSLEKELGPWSAPPETLRPPNPYHSGGVLLIQKHKACSPFGPDYRDYAGLRQTVKEQDLRAKTLVEICLQNPPMEGETAVDEPPRTLHIIDGIRVKEDGGAQLVSCRLDGEPAKYAAKIYDPLYYGFADRMWSDMPRDVTTEADKDYCREVAAYTELDEQFGGKEVPKFHGSWTFTLPLDLPDGRRTRDVRMILMELIRGGTMSDMDPPPYSEEVRLEVLARTLEAFNRIHAAGVIHRDIAQRNVMICDGQTATGIDRIVIIDFNFAVVTRLAEWSRRHKGQSLPEKPRNPIDDWWDCGGLYDGFGDWLPASWDRLYKPLQEWLYARWGNSNEFLPHKEPLTWEDAEE